MYRCFMWLIIPYIALATGCATQSTPPSQAVQCPEPSKVPVLMACPSSLAPLPDDTMGALANALMDTAETYYACRAAAVAR